MSGLTKCPVCGIGEFFEKLPSGSYHCVHCHRYFRFDGVEFGPPAADLENPAGPDSVAADQGHAVKAPATFEDAFDAIIAELRELMIKKQRDYGHENITAFGEFGVLVRLNDKVARLRNLLSKDKEPQNESIEDSWWDIANYAIIAQMLRRGIFTLPLSEDIQAS
ncbi:MAG: DUF1599 domain-containing protein [Firmicutes bacterium]|nr:DUF1599 domain-containing protein [Bacillota bacterium]